MQAHVLLVLVLLPTYLPPSGALTPSLHPTQTSPTGSRAAHHCYIDRDGNGKRLKFMFDLSLAVLKRADEEIERDEGSFSIRPGKRGRKSKKRRANAPPTTPGQGQPAKKPRQKWEHNKGAHTYKAIGLPARNTRPCAYCTLLKRNGAALCTPTGKIRATSTGCKRCSLQTKTSGVVVCDSCWGTRGFERWHNAQFPRVATEDMLDTTRASPPGSEAESDS